jgi:hypothetical protein
MNPEYQHQLETQRKDARDAAIQALEAIYRPSYPPAGSGVPAYTAVPQIGGNTPGGTPVSSSPNTVTGPNPTDTAAAPGTDQNASNPNQTDQPRTDPSADGPTAAQPTGTNPASLGLPTGSPATNTAPGTTTMPGTTTTTAGLSPGTTTGASPTGSPTGIGPLGALGTGSRPGGPGSSQPGTPGATGPGEGRNPLGATGRGSSGSPMGPMTPGMAGQRKDGQDDERQHQIPDYLRGIQPEWTEGLPAPVGVIGSDLIPEQDNTYQRIEPAPAPANHAPAVTIPARADATPSISAFTEDHSRSGPAASTPHPEQSADAAAPSPATPDSEQTTRISPALASLFAEYGWTAEPTQEPADARQPRSTKNEGSAAPTAGTDR